MSIHAMIQNEVHSDTAQLLRFERIAVHGCGAVGSALVELLSRIHALRRTETAVWLCDRDSYEMKNYGTQLIEPEFVGVRKDHAMANKALMRGLSTVVDDDVTLARMMAGGTSPSATFVQTDSMGSRQAIWQMYCDSRVSNPRLVYVDTRVGWDNIEIYGFRPSSSAMRHRYRETLYSDDQAQQEVCGRRMSFATAVIAAGLAVRTAYHLASQLPGSGRDWMARIISLEDVGVVPEEFFQAAKEDE